MFDKTADFIQDNDHTASTVQFGDGGEHERVIVA